MDFVICLAAHPAAGAILEDSRVPALRDRLAAEGFVMEPMQRLAAQAIDLPLRSPAPVDASVRLRRALEGLPLDSAILAQQRRRKSLLLADMDATMVEGETLDELAEEAGIKPRIAAITERAMRGEIDFAGALRERVGLLAGLEVGAIDRVLARTRLMAGAGTLVVTMRAHGAFCALVSGGFTEFTSAVRARIGFDLDRSNRLEIRESKLTGRVQEPILDKEAKRRLLHELAAERGLPLQATAAVGDGANDLPMLLDAGLGVAFHAKPAVAEAARVQVRHGDLTTLLWFQGYREAEVVRRD